MLETADLLLAVRHDKGRVNVLDRPRRREATGGHWQILRYASGETKVTATIVKLLECLLRERAT